MVNSLSHCPEMLMNLRKKGIENIVVKGENAGNQHLKANSFIKVPIAANWKGVCLQNTSKLHSYHLKIW